MAPASKYTCTMTIFIMISLLDITNLFDNKNKENGDKCQKRSLCLSNAVEKKSALKLKSCLWINFQSLK